MTIFEYTNTLPVEKDEQLRSIDPIEAYSYRGDFVGLLMLLNVDPSHWDIVMHINKIKTSADFDGQMSSILLPDMTVL